MTKFTRLAALAAFTAFVATPAFAQSTPVAATPKATATARIVRPLTLTATQNLSFGTIVVSSLASSQAVSVSQAGALSGCTGALTCSGTVAAARYNVTGTNNQLVQVNSVGSNLTNTTSGGSELLAFSPNAPANVTLTSSGAPGTNFNVGGSITITPTTVDGLYVGSVEVTVNY